MRALFVCTANQLMSQNVEDFIKAWPRIQGLSAGTNADSIRPLTNVLVSSADIIFVLEPHHRERIRMQFTQRPPDERIITLHISEELERGELMLICLLKAKCEGYIRRFSKEC